MSVADRSESDYSDEDFSDFYSGAAKRYKKEKQAVCPTGEVRLVNQKEKKQSTAEKNVSPTPAHEIDDSSDEELFRDPNTETHEVSLDESEIIQPQKQVETLEDIEQYINVTPDVSFSEERKVYSSASVQAIDEIEFEEDPLYCTPLNDSELNLVPDDDEIVMVKVRFVAQKVWRIELKRAEYFKTICQKLSESTGVDAGKINLYFNEQLLDVYDSLKTRPLRITDIIDALVCNDNAMSTPNDSMLEFKVQSQNRNSQVVVSIRAEDPMKILMQKYAEATGCNLGKLTFKFDGELLADSDTPSNLELEGGECIDVYVRE
ncbi:NFATC2-interacting protein-like [Daphnia carinata]|uniref:NFATC2-interacting protein-like n=1 Tax=Daphnia carinata TaxID=120202 RepID=UPI00257AC6D4|nr:NFATC2-interacting protein-like [Daphnia carinata]